MNLHLAQRTKVAPSATVAVVDTVRALRRQGVDVVDLGGGDPDFTTPPHIIEAATRAMRRGDTHYVDSAGVFALREAIAAKLERENAIRVTADHILVTPGAKAALYAAIQAFVEPGVDVLVLEPAWVSYRPMVEAAGGRVCAVPLDGANGFEVTYAALSRALTPTTRVLIVNSPNNPTGRLLSRRELEVLARFACEHELLVLADEIYEHLVYIDRSPISLATLPGMAERTLTVNGFSKSWAMTGWRIGYLAGPLELVRACKVLHAHMVTCASSFGQAGALAALQGDREPMLEMVKAWGRRRTMLASSLSSIAGLACPLPDGAFYALVDIRRTGLDSSTFARQLLERQRVAVTPGVAFGAAGEGYVRLSFATADSELERAVERIEAFMHHPPSLEGAP